MRGSAVAVDPQGRYAAVTGYGERFEVIDLASGDVRDMPTPTMTTSGAAFTPDGARLVVSAQNASPVAGPLLWFSVPDFERLDVPSPIVPVHTPVALPVWR